MRYLRGECSLAYQCILFVSTHSTFFFLFFRLKLLPLGPWPQVVDTSAEAERKAAQQADDLRAIRAESRKKDRALQSLVLQLSQTQHDAQATQLGAAAMVHEATRIIQDRKQQRHR
jgi:hypothetical protein